MSKCANPNGKTYSDGPKVEWNIPCSALKVGDIVSPQKHYITANGYWYDTGAMLKVLRLNRNSVGVAKLVSTGADRMDYVISGRPYKISETNRIFRISRVCDYSGEYAEEEPIFGRLKR